MPPKKKKQPVTLLSILMENRDIFPDGPYWMLDKVSGQWKRVPPEPHKKTKKTKSKK